MQAIIPVAGAGTRLRPLTYTQPKVLISVAGKPILSFIVDELVENGITDFVFVIGYLGEKIKEFVEKNYPNLNAKFVQQDKRAGLGHAVWMAKDELDLEELEFLLKVVGNADLKGHQVEMFYKLIIKLQNQYIQKTK